MIYRDEIERGERDERERGEREERERGMREGGERGDIYIYIYKGYRERRERWGERERREMR